MGKIVRPSICEEADKMAVEMLLPAKAVNAYLTLHDVALDDDDSIYQMSQYFAVPIGILVARIQELTKEDK